MAVVVGGVAVGAWRLLPDGHRPAADRPVPRHTVGAGAPAGYVRVDDPEGFTLDVPRGWRRARRERDPYTWGDTERAGAAASYRSPDGRALIRVATLTGDGTTPYQALAATEDGARRRHPDYRRVELVRGGPGDGAAAELQYRYTSARRGPRRVVDRAFTGVGGARYEVLVAGPAGDWPRQRDRLRAAVGALCPTAYCTAR